MSPSEKISTKDNLLKLISISIFLDQKTREEIQKKIPTLNDLQIFALFSLFSEADKKQKQLIKQVIQKQPDFLSQVKHVYSKGKMESSKKNEKDSRKSEEEILKKLEQELRSK